MSLIVKVLRKRISLMCFRVRLEVQVRKNPTALAVGVSVYCDCDFDEENWSAIALSQDKFHEKIPDKNIRKLSLLKVFNAGDKKVNWDLFPLIESGRAVNLVSNYKTRENYMSIPDIYLPRAGEISVSKTTTLTCDGDLISACDYAYDQLNELKKSPYFIENVNFENWIDKIKKKFC
ncbi:MAG: hypothetical protein UH542_06135 [Bacteroidales bacterium]|nr:hypothetical protein [Bacteroidales bacterium]